MPKFLVLYNSSASAKDTMANATPEQMQESINEWINWRNQASKTATIDFGQPLQSVGHVTPTGNTSSDSQIGGYAIIEADSADTVLELLKTHPQLQRPDASIDVFEMLPMPGISQ